MQYSQSRADSCRGDSLNIAAKPTSLVQAIYQSRASRDWHDALIISIYYATSPAFKKVLPRSLNQTRKSLFVFGSKFINEHHEKSIASLEPIKLNMIRILKVISSISILLQPSHALPHTASSPRANPINFISSENAALLQFASQTHPTTNLSVTYPVECVPTSLWPGLRHVDPLDCEYVLDVLLHDENLYDKQTVSKDPTAGIQVGVAWKMPSCWIFLSTTEPHPVDNFRVIDIAVQARRIINECVLDQKTVPYGGTAEIGLPKNRLYVGVGGPKDHVGNNFSTLSPSIATS